MPPKRHRFVTVPEQAIAAATERRLAGDYAGACAAVQISCEVSLRRVAIRFGLSEARRLEHDLQGLVPDLLRWHIPPPADAYSRRLMVLSRLTDPLRMRPFLGVEHLIRPKDGMRLRLRVVNRAVFSQSQWEDVPGYLWHVDDLPHLRNAWGDDSSRMPERHEAISRALQAGEVGQAWAMEGIELVPHDPVNSRWSETILNGALRRFPVHPLGLVAETKRLCHRYGGTKIAITNGEGWNIVIGLASGGVPTARIMGYLDHSDVAIPRISETVLLPIRRRLGTLWQGTIAPGDLHPLVHQTLFPDQAASFTGTREKFFCEPVRVRCGGAWHFVEVGPEGLDLGHHDAGSGCAKVAETWRTGRGRLPKQLRRQRDRFFSAALHGFASDLRSIVDDGFDLRTRDSNGRTLMHYLPFIDLAQQMLPWLLERGLDVNDVDHAGQTALHTAVVAGAPEVVTLLLDSGANRWIRDYGDGTPQDLINIAGSASAELKAELAGILQGHRVGSAPAGL